MTHGHRFRSNMLMEHFTNYCSGKKKKWESIGFTLNILPLEDWRIFFFLVTGNQSCL